MTDVPADPTSTATDGADTAAAGATTLDPLLLEIVVCPACRADLDLRRPEPGRVELACRGCGLVYPVVDGIPVLLVDEARRP